MKIAIPVNTKFNDREISTTFGRAPSFMIYDNNDKSMKFIDNAQNLNAVQGAGIQSAQNIIKEDVNSLITFHCGPKAFKVLKAAGITIYQATSNNITLSLELLSTGSLVEIVKADVQGHWM